MLGRLKTKAEFFSTPPETKPYFRSGKMPVHHGEGSYIIHSIKTLENLLTEKRRNKEHPVLRFLVDTSGIAWFAREHTVGIDAPKHFQMTGKTVDNAYCLAAGNVKFKNSKCTVLKSLNHRSGDFRPSLHSLRIFLAILILNEKQLPFKLPRILVVKELSDCGNKTYKHRWSIRRIKAWVKTFADQDALIKQLSAQDVDAKTVFYKATAHFNPILPPKPANLFWLKKMVRPLRSRRLSANQKKRA